MQQGAGTSVPAFFLKHTPHFGVYRTYINSLQIMFGLFKKRSEMEQLQEQYKKLTEEAFRLSAIDRRKGDEKMAQADEVAKKIEQLKAAQS